MGFEKPNSMILKKKIYMNNTWDFFFFLTKMPTLNNACHKYKFASSLSSFLRNQPHFTWSSLHSYFLKQLVICMVTPCKFRKYIIFLIVVLLWGTNDRIIWNHDWHIQLYNHDGPTNDEKYIGACSSGVCTRFNTIGPPKWNNHSESTQLCIHAEPTIKEGI